MHCVYHYSRMIRGCELTDAMAEVENMRGARAVGVCMGRSKAVKNFEYLLFNGRGMGKQHIRV